MRHSLNTYTIHKIRKKSEEFGIPFRLALWTRKRALQTAVNRWQAEYEDEIDAVTLHFILSDIRKAKKEIAALDAEISRIESKSEISDEMIARAREYPVDKLVDFRHGKVGCFAHEDRNPSMYHGTRTNRACCPVCNKSWDGIGILTERDGYSFHEAVRRLQ